MTDGSHVEGSKPGHVRRTRVRVRYAETDQMGFAYYGNYLTWFEVARVEWLRLGGWTYRDMEQQGTSLPVIEAHCEYRQPARYDDELEIAARGVLLSPVRIRFDYDVVRVADNSLAATGHTVHAGMDARGKPCRLPERVREMLS
jgi:acyl-CoA thioester hydrolase